MKKLLMLICALSFVPAFAMDDGNPDDLNDKFKHVTKRSNKREKARRERLAKERKENWDRMRLLYIEKMKPSDENSNIAKLPGEMIWHIQSFVVGKNPPSKKNNDQ